MFAGGICRPKKHARYLRDAVRALADDPSPASLLERVNRAFCRRVADDGDDRFASSFLATREGRRLTYESAGHDFALLMSADGRHRHLPATGVIMGINEADRYQDHVLAVASGDWLILVTDGVTEERDAKGTFFGKCGVVQSALAAVEGGVDDPAARIQAAQSVHFTE